MAISHSVWCVGPNPLSLPEATLASEQLLEEMIVAAPEILSDEWMIIGRQEITDYGGRMDLLAIAPDSSLILIELKRGRTPREVVAQAIDYASWIEQLTPDQIQAIYSRFKEGADLKADFRARFCSDIDEGTLNESHQIVIVSSSLDASSERIVSYLNKRDIAINVLCFQIFQHRQQQLLSRAWLMDPIETQVSANVTSSASKKEPWNGEYYVSFGHDQGRSWTEAAKYGFVSAGGGAWYSNTLSLLKPGDRIWVKAPKYGFVGVGRIRGSVEPATSFKIKMADGSEQLATKVLKEYQLKHLGDPEKMEYFVPVEWAQTVPIEQAFDEIGLFGNQNTVCAPKTPKWRHTIERLKRAFPNFDRLE